MMDDERRANMAAAHRRWWAGLSDQQRTAHCMAISLGMERAWQHMDKVKDNPWQPPPGYEEFYAELRRKKASRPEARRMIEEHIIIAERRKQRAEQQNGEAHAVGTFGSQGEDQKSEDAGAEKAVGQNSKQRSEIGQV